MSTDADLLAAAFSLSLDAIVMMDDEGRLIDWNPAAEHLLGWSRDDAVGRLAADLLVPPIHRDAHEAGLRRFRATGQGSVLGQVLDHLEARHRDGHFFPVELRIAEAGRSGDRSVFVAFLRDISDRKRAERLQAMRHAVTGIIANATGWDAALGDLLEALCVSLGLAMAEAWLPDDAGTHLRRGGSWRLSDVDLSEFDEGSRSLTFPRGVGLPGRVWAEGGPVALLDLSEEAGFTRHRSARSHGLRGGVAFPLLMDDQVLGVVTLFGGLESIDAALLEAVGDIGTQIGHFLQRTRIESALSKAQDEVRAALEFQAFHDALTGLPNPSLFNDRLEEAMAIAERETRNLALLILDLDGFKEVNDHFGHLNGDVVLKETAERLRRAMRRADTVARLGGDEFAVIPHGHLDEAGLQRVAEKVAAALQAPIDLEIASVSVRASIGGALYPRDAKEPRQMVRSADAAMYHAKRNRLDFACYAPGMRAGSDGPISTAPADQMTPTRVD